MSSDLPTVAGNIVQAFSTDLQCLVLFHPEEGVPQAILQPFTEDDNLLLVSLDHTAITSKNPDNPQSNTCTIEFEQQIDEDNNPVRDDLINNSCLVWSDSQGKNAIHSRQVLLHILHSMQQHGKVLIASGDLYSSQRTAATLFFQSKPPCIEPYSSSSSSDDDNEEDGKADDENIAEDANVMTEICCIGFHNTDKIRLYQFSSEEANGLSNDVISKNWKFGIIKDNVQKFIGIPEFKLAESPWWTFETSNEHHLEARRLVLGIFNYMWHRGYHTVVPVDCYVKGYLGVQGDMDNLIFYRNIRFDEQSQTRHVINKNEPTEFICLCLERTHKLRIVGTSADGTTHQAVRQAVAESWSQGVKESSIYEDSYQIKVNGTPWGHRTTPEAVAAAQLVCTIIEALFEHGWIWHCAIDMTRSLVDKSTFFFRRVARPLTNIRIGCIQPKGLSKINLVRFPPSFLITIMEELQTNKNSGESGVDNTDDGWFGAGISEITIHENGMSGTIEFDTNIHTTTEDNIKNQVVRNSKIYRKLITRLLEYQYPHTKLLGFGDIWTCETKDDELYIRDTDACFFSFPYKEHDWNMTSTHSLV